MFKPLLIHKGNTPIKIKFDNANSFKFDIDCFDFSNSDLDTCISKKIISELIQKDFNIIFIKDNLSDNYLELYGIILAYHIRLSPELEEKRFIPIVVISDIDGYVLNKLEPLANILFTKNTFVVKNEISSLSYFQKVFNQITPIFDFKKEFLSQIQIEPPKDYLSHHGIANEWSIYRWAEFLKVKSDAITTNKSKIENMLYFKYLKALYAKNEIKTKKIIKPKEKGKILLIDDEWANGWNDILSSALKSQNVKFTSMEYKYKDKSYWAIPANISKKIEDFKPDVVILDLRLIQSDHETDDIDNYSGIKILQKIHKINAGIQVIMLTATNKSTILEKLYEKKILGYIKKEHPNDISIDTIENINKLVGLVDKGLDRKYLKQVFNMQNEILSLNLFEELVLSFEMDKKDKKLLELKNTVSRIFETLDSNIPKPFVYGMLTLYKCIEIINDYFIYEHYDNEERKIKAYWIYNNIMIPNNGNVSVNNKIKSIVNLLDIGNQKIRGLIDEISCSRNYEIHSGEIRHACENKVVQEPNETHIVEWFNMITIILVAINTRNI